MTRRGNVVAIAVGVAVLVSACASDVAAPNTTVAEVEVDTTPPPTSTEAPPTTSITPNTDAPTTTLDPAATLAADVEADLLEAFRSTVKPRFGSDERREGAAAWLALGIESNRDFIAEQLDEYRANGWALGPNADVQAAVIVEVPPTLIVPATTSGRQVQICEVDSWIVVEPGAGPERNRRDRDPDVSSVPRRRVPAKHR